MQGNLCDVQAHCLCKCNSKLRLPKQELIWIKAQREKEGSVSSMQEFRLDAEETAKLRKKDLRKSVDQARLQRQREEALEAKQQAATTVDPCIVTFDADDVGDDIEIDDSNDEIVSDSEGDSVSHTQKTETILISVVLLLPQSGLVCHLLPLLLSSMVFWAIF